MVHFSSQVPASGSISLVSCQHGWVGVLGRVMLREDVFKLLSSPTPFGDMRPRELPSLFTPVHSGSFLRGKYQEEAIDLLFLNPHPSLSPEHHPWPSSVQDQPPLLQDRAEK